MHFQRSELEVRFETGQKGNGDSQASIKQGEMWSGLLVQQTLFGYRGREGETTRVMAEVQWHALT